MGAQHEKWLLPYKYTQFKNTHPTPQNKAKLMSSSKDNTVRIWDVLGKPQCSKVLPGHSGPVGGCAFTSDAKWAVTAGNDKLMRVWSTNPDELDDSESDSD